MNDWVWWCIGCYTILTLAPSLSLLLAKLRTSLDIAGSQQLYDIRGEVFGLRNKSSQNFSSALPPSPSLSFKYSPLRNLDSDFESESKPNNLFKSAFGAFFSRLEYCAQLMSVSNRNSIRWRMLLALGLWLSYVIPVTFGNESRDFDPARSAPSFDINHPEPLCSASVMQGIPPRYDSFEGYWQEYLQFHQQMVLPEEDGGVPEKDKRFLVFQPSDDGLGNRLQSLLSSVVMAMVTRRAIVLDWLAQPQCNANFTDLFQQPEGLQWDLNTTIPNYKEVPYYKEKPEIWYPYCRNCALRSPITPDSTWSDLLCNENLGINSSLPLVQIISTQWFLPVIQHNPYWRRELCHMFPQVNELNPEQSVGFGNAFEVLAKKLLKPSKAVQQKIDSVMDRIPEDATLIGLQVRRTENNAVGKGIEDSFLSCAASVVGEEEENAARESGSVWGSDLDDFSELKNDISDNNNGNNNGIDDIDIDESDSAIVLQDSTSFRKRYAYYLATDYRPTRAHFQRVLGDQLFVLENTFESQKDAESLGLSASDSDRNATENILGDEDIDVDGDNEFDSDSDSVNIQPTTALKSKQTEAVVRNSVQGVQIAVAEMFLLAQSDRIISSPYSTFGYFAHGYANIQPNIVKRDGQCIKRKSTQPCFQYWFGFANGGAKCSIKATIDMSEDYDCWL
ncbi:hypothetical protein BGX21_011543 [Mortierella sp. AD011]|nr:hypothetical protein BGX20_008291 [Mortierella sp. AD010]KAF9390125.1 hypothetical protein BGX21_011543 [Mortierella sp. AD011]